MSGNQILKKARALAEHLAAFHGEAAEGDTLVAMVKTLLEHLPPDTPPEEVSRRLCHWRGRKVDAETTWRMALAALAWRHGDTEFVDWRKGVSMRVVVDEVTSREGRTAIQMVCLTGPLAGHVVKWNGSSGKAFEIASVAGFPKWKNVPGIKELAGMLLSVVVRDRSIKEFGASDSDISHNDKLRSDRRKCRFYDSYPCGKCPRGRDTCPLAARPRTMRKGEDGKWTPVK